MKLAWERFPDVLALGPNGSQQDFLAIFHRPQGSLPTKNRAARFVLEFLRSLDLPINPAWTAPSRNADPLAAPPVETQTAGAPALSLVRGTPDDEQHLDAEAELGQAAAPSAAAETDPESTAHTESDRSRRVPPQGEQTPPASNGHSSPGKSRDQHLQGALALALNLARSAAGADCLRLLAAAAQDPEGASTVHADLDLVAGFARWLAAGQPEDRGSRSA